MHPTTKVTKHAKSWTRSNPVPVRDSVRVVRGSHSRAGGTGELFARSHGYSSSNWSTHNFYHADGNGNITYLVNCSQGLAAKYRYDPFGNTISSSGTLASANVYRFSSKELHVNSGLYYYGYRWYDPNLQRWLNRDPLGNPTRQQQPQATGILDNEFFPFEYFNGGNLYFFVRNAPVSLIDPFGLDIWIIREQCGDYAGGILGHEWVVGDNGDGTYWQSEKNPSEGGLKKYICKAKIDFNENSGFKPRDEPWRFSPVLCEVIVRHVVTTPEVDKKVRDEAERRARENKDNYNAACDNCRHNSNELATMAKNLMKAEK